MPDALRPLHDELQSRGFLYQQTSPDFFEKFDAGSQNFYFGVDPTADSMHLGNFIVFMHAIHYLRRGNKLFLVVGGATGMIGDPGGRDSERSFLDPETISKNVASIERQARRILENFDIPQTQFQIINNADFYRDFSVLEFLRDIGKFLTINTMIAKETVKTRIDDPEKSISYTEFSYMLLQSYDFLRLHQDHGVTLQIASSDQRGNITAGTELIRKKLGTEVFGATGPLVLDASGKKFGKSAGNALRLDPAKTHPNELFQYFLNTADADLDRFLKLLSLRSLDEISQIVATHAENPAARRGQKILATEAVTHIFSVHHAARCQTLAEISAEILSKNPQNPQRRNPETKEFFPARHDEMSALLDRLQVPTLDREIPAIDAVLALDLAESRSDAKKLFAQKCFKFCGQILTDPTQILPTQKLSRLQKGKKDLKFFRRKS